MFEKFLSLLLCLIMVLSLISCGDSSRDEPVKDVPPVTEDVIEDENTEHEDLSNPDAPDYRDDTIGDNMGGITTCMVGETVDVHNCRITLVGYKISEGNDWYVPENGCYVGVNFIIENTSDIIINPNDGKLFFTGYADDFYVESTWAEAVFGEGIYADIAPDKKVNGWIVFDINPDWNKLELDFLYYDEENYQDVIEARFLVENEG